MYFRKWKFIAHLAFKIDWNGSSSIYIDLEKYQINIWQKFKYNNTFISFFLFCSCKQTEEFLKNGGATKKIYMSDEVTHCLGKKYII